MSKPKTIVTLPRPLLRIHRELGIPADYAAQRRLSPYQDAVESELVEVGMNDEGRPIRLVRPVAEAWGRMRRSAARDDVELVPISGFRSIARQTEIVREKLAAGKRLEDVLRYVAAPGFSEHHTGRALDIGSPDHLELDEDFAHTAAFNWLESHARTHGFVMSYPRNNAHGIGFEPWHWFNP